MDVTVHQDAAATQPVDVHDARNPALRHGEPGVGRQVQVVPLLPQLGSGPIGVVVDGAVACLHERKDLVEVCRRVGAANLHGQTALSMGTQCRRSILLLRDD